ncbi:MAG: biotin--[Clostridia bacterium]|nr:biotin--[acetyl-CoA-carboxylase] ligase [Clostridia bacterium]
MPHPAFLDTDTLRHALGGYADTVDITLLDTVDSTNNTAKSTALTVNRPALYVAHTQTGGRGRLGRSFHSPADTGLYMTVAYTTDRPLTEAVRVTAGAAVAAVTAIETLTDKSPAIKWVNDVYLDGCKIGGILTEAVTLPDGRNRMIVGLGLNLTTTEFPDGLRAPASCLFNASEAVLATPAFMGTLAGEITRRLLELADGAPNGGLWGEDCLTFYRRHLLYVGDSVLCTRGSEAFEGIVMGVNDDYSLVVKSERETHILSSGEISVRPSHRA